MIKKIINIIKAIYNNIKYKIKNNKIRLATYSIIPIFSINLLVSGVSFTTAYTIKSTMFEIVKIRGSAMKPTFNDGDRTVITKFDKNNLNRGDIVVFLTEDKKRMIKRIVAFEGETIQIKYSKLYVNKKLIDDFGFLKNRAFSYGEFISEDKIYTIPLNTIFVLGDNPEDSYDSRHFGPISRDCIYGRVTNVLYKSN